METVDINIANATLPPANHLLRPLIDSAQPRNNIREEVQDKMMIDEQHPGDEVMHPCSKDKPSLPSIKSLSSISSAIPANMTPDDYIRHRMSDMTVSQPQLRQHVSGPSPLEPNSHQSFYESFSRRGSITDPASFHSTSRRPSIAEVLPLPNSAVQSRRGSVATDYDCPSRSPSPSAFTRQRLYDNQDGLSYSFGRRYSLSNGANNANNGSKHPLAPPPSNAGSFYDPFQRRHSIATAETSYSSTSRYGSAGGNNTSASKYKAFKFPSTIPELPTYDTCSAPPSPSQLVNTGRPEFMQDKAATSRYSHSSQLMDNHHGGPISLSSQRRKASLVEDYRATEPYTPVRRASMPLVTVRSASSLPQLSEEDINGNGIDLLVSDRERPRKETPYSRSPALRISHKLAERKRRKEMKCLFDELRDALPVEKNMKTSKWEILSKAVEYISLLKRRDYDLENEINELRREIDAIKRERTSNYTPPYYSG